MTEITLSRGSDSVTLDARVEGGNLPLVYSVSKPEQNLSIVSDLNPRARDNFANVQSFTISGNITGDSAYADARFLQQKLIKEYANGTALILDLSNFDGFGMFNVAPINPNSCEVEYIPGQTDWVPFTLNLTRHTDFVDSGGEQFNTDPSPVPSEGNVTITNPVNSESITLTKNVRVTRSVGRPNSNITPLIDDVKYIDKIQSAEDVFEIRGQLASATADTDAKDAVDLILGQPLGRSSLTLDFDGLYGLGEYNVVPQGGQAGRVTVTAGENDMRTFGPVSFQVVTN